LPAIIAFLFNLFCPEKNLLFFLMQLHTNAFALEPGAETFWNGMVLLRSWQNRFFKLISNSVIGLMLDFRAGHLE
jgi:hypothetical protein